MLCTYARGARRSVWAARPLLAPRLRPDHHDEQTRGAWEKRGSLSRTPGGASQCSLSGTQSPRTPRSSSASPASCSGEALDSGLGLGACRGQGMLPGPSSALPSDGCVSLGLSPVRLTVGGNRTTLLVFGKDRRKSRSKTLRPGPRGLGLFAPPPVRVCGGSKAPSPQHGELSTTTAWPSPQDHQPSFGHTSCPVSHQPQPPTHVGSDLLRVRRRWFTKRPLLVSEHCPPSPRLRLHQSGLV